MESQLEDGVGIWRYMDVARFLALVSESKLYFNRPHELADAFEGVWTLPASYAAVSSVTDAEYLRSVVSEFNRLTLISCWHRNERESVAMWKALHDWK